jgi:peptidoglycan/xylan/chitin deacetylase (PgdA/CDA1 family)
MGRIAKTVGLTICSAAATLIRPRGLPVILYHSIDDSCSYLSTSRKIFEVQMKYLKSQGFKSVSMDRLMTLKYSGRQAPAKSVVLTFDDGLRNFRTNAWPLLAHLGFSATVFVPTNFIGGESSWYADFGLAPMPMMDWSELREVKEQGADIQSHGCSHRELNRLSLSKIRREVRESKDTLEQALGCPVNHFCYPFGEENEEVRSVLKEAGYQSGSSVVQGLYRFQDDPYSIKRLGLDLITLHDAKTAVRAMRACVQGSFTWYVRIRKALIGHFVTPPHTRSSLPCC